MATNLAPRFTDSQIKAEPDRLVVSDDELGLRVVSRAWAFAADGCRIAALLVWVLLGCFIYANLQTVHLFDFDSELREAIRYQVDKQMSPVVQPHRRITE